MLQAGVSQPSFAAWFRWNDLCASAAITHGRRVTNAPVPFAVETEIAQIRLGSAHVPPKHNVAVAVAHRRLKRINPARELLLGGRQNNRSCAILANDPHCAVRSLPPTRTGSCLYQQHLMCLRHRNLLP